MRQDISVHVYRSDFIILHEIIIISIQPEWPCVTQCLDTTNYSETPFQLLLIQMAAPN